MTPNEVTCPKKTCNAAPGEHCRDTRDKRIPTGYHNERIRACRKADPMSTSAPASCFSTPRKEQAQ